MDRDTRAAFDNQAELDRRFMRAALEQARAAAALGEVPIGAVVVREGEIIAAAHNRRELDQDPSAHAEFSALMKAARALGRWRLTDCTVYVTLEPCPMCAGLMVNARVGRCVYGAADPKAGALGSLYRLDSDVRLNHAFPVTAGMLAEECRAELRAFFAARRASVRGGSAMPAKASAAPEHPIAAPIARRDAGDALRAVGQIGTSDERAMHADLTSSESNSASPSMACGESEGRYHGRACGDEGGAHSCVEAGARVPSPAGVSPVLAADVAHAQAKLLAGRDAGTRAKSRASQSLSPFPAAPAPHVLLAIDSFKGCATSSQVEAWVAEGIRSGLPSAEVTCLPLADGGEGTLEAVRAALSGQLIELEVSGPLGDAVHAKYLFTGEIAVIESAQAAGLHLSGRTDADARRASTGGVGELVLDAMRRGARRVYVGLGGTCTNDGGAGFLAALGARLLTNDGNAAAQGLEGLSTLASVDLAPATAVLAGIELHALTDVKNPLVGRRGALAIFGSQKGLDNPAEHDAAMVGYARLLDAARVEAEASAPADPALEGARRRFSSVAGVPGAGAAGGLGAAMLALGAQLESGVDTVLDLIGFDRAAARADLIITGEGHMDAQTAAGKAPVGVARRAKRARAGVSVVAVVGGASPDLEPVYAQGIDLVIPACREPMPLEEALDSERARENIISAGEQTARAWAMSRPR